MHWIAPDILLEARGLSNGLLIFSLVVGVLLWFFGWRWHRFWIGLTITIVGGYLGVISGKATGTHAIAMGVLLAAASAILAIELARILAFAAGGVLCWWLMRFLFPAGQDLWVSFLAGGLLGIWLYRIWWILLTSFTGIMLSWHAALLLLEKPLNKDMVEWAERNSAYLNAAVIGTTVMGLVMQSFIERIGIKWEEKRDARREEKIREAERERLMHGVILPLHPPKKRSVWQKMTFCKAG